jgi:hypothetical protein
MDIKYSTIYMGKFQMWRRENMAAKEQQYTVN